VDAKTSKQPVRSADEIRSIILRYLYDRNRNATSRRGKAGAAVRISDMRAGLKASHGLTVPDIHSNLTYLESQGWVENQPVTKTVTTRTGGTIPSTTDFHIITAAGIDKIEGPGMYTRDRFEGIKIEATGQNIITLGDGNQVNAQFKGLAESLAELRTGIKESQNIDDSEKLDLVVDIDTLQSQLAKRSPDRDLVAKLWEGINRAASLAGLADVAVKVSAMVSAFFP